MTNPYTTWYESRAPEYGNLGPLMQRIEAWIAGIANPEMYSITQLAEESDTRCLDEEGHQHFHVDAFFEALYDNMTIDGVQVYTWLQEKAWLENTMGGSMPELLEELEEYFYFACSDYDRSDYI